MRLVRPRTMFSSVPRVFTPPAFVGPVPTCSNQGEFVDIIILIDIKRLRFLKRSMGHFERTFAAKTSWWAEERGRCSWPRGSSYQLPLAGPVPTCQEIDKSSMKLQRKGAIEKLLIQMQFCAKTGRAKDRGYPWPRTDSHHLPFAWPVRTC